MRERKTEAKQRKPGGRDSLVKKQTEKDNVRVSENERERKNGLCYVSFPGFCLPSRERQNREIHKWQNPMRKSEKERKRGREEERKMKRRKKGKNMKTRVKANLRAAKMEFETLAKIVVLPGRKLRFCTKLHSDPSLKLSFHFHPCLVFNLSKLKLKFRKIPFQG